MNPTPYVRPGLPGPDPEAPGRELLGRWSAEHAARAAGRPGDAAFRRVALARKLARTAPAGPPPDDGPDVIALALSACDLAGWNERLTRFVEVDGDDPVVLIDEFDDLELVWAAAERAGLAPGGLRADLDASVGRLLDLVGGSPAATRYARAVGATLHPDLPVAAPVLARTADKFVALLDAAEAVVADAAPLPRLRLPPGTPVVTTPAGPNRIPPLPATFAFKAGTAGPLPPVPPLEWRSPDRQRTAVLAVPRVPPDHRRLYLVITPADDLTGKPVLLGGLRAVVEAGGRVGFDWDDMVAIGAMIDHLQIGGRVAWTCLSPTNRGG